MDGIFCQNYFHPELCSLVDKSVGYMKITGTNPSRFWANWVDIISVAALHSHITSHKQSVCLWYFFPPSDCRFCCFLLGLLVFDMLRKIWNYVCVGEMFFSWCIGIVIVYQESSSLQLALLAGEGYLSVSTCTSPLSVSITIMRDTCTSHSMGRRPWCIPLASNVHRTSLCTVLYNMCLTN